MAGYSMRRPRQTKKGGGKKREQEKKKNDPVRKLTTLKDEEVQGFSRSEPGADIRTKEQMH
jgi:hypothetical protein